MSNSLGSVIKVVAGTWHQCQMVGKRATVRKGAETKGRAVLLLHRTEPRAVLCSEWEASRVVALPKTTTRWCSSLGQLVIHNSSRVRWFLHLSCRTASAEGPADPPLTGREGDDFPGHDWMQHSLAWGWLPNTQPESALPLQHRGGSQRRTADEKCNKWR